MEVKKIIINNEERIVVTSVDYCEIETNIMKNELDDTLVDLSLENTLEIELSGNYE